MIDVDDFNEDAYAAFLDEEYKRKNKPEPSGGLSANEREQLEKIAPLNKWDIFWDGERGKYMTHVKCPECGEVLLYFCETIHDFYCSVCEFEWADNPDMLPVPA